VIGCLLDRTAGSALFSLNGVLLPAPFPTPIEQLSSGSIGPVITLEPGQQAAFNFGEDGFWLTIPEAYLPVRPASLLAAGR
jgi:hypothetical protein